MSNCTKTAISVNLIKGLLKDVYFINGTAYAGKSTMARYLADKYDGVLCGENYHAELMPLINADCQPNLSYFKTMSGWQEFVSRTPEQYERWVAGVAEEASELELLKLIQLAEPGRRIFVDTNIPPEMLWQISDYEHVAIMLCPQSMSVDRFFDRNDEDKQLLLRVISQSDDPERTMENFRRCIERINSVENYNAFLNSGFFVHLRDEKSTVEEARRCVEAHFKLGQGQCPCTSIANDAY